MPNLAHFTGVVSDITGKPKQTRRFGNSATLARWPDARLPGPSSTFTCNPRYVDLIFDEIWGRTLTTLERWSIDQPGSFSGTQPHKLIDPIYAITVDDKGLYIDLIGEIVPANDAIDWTANRFNSMGTKSFLRRGIEESCARWAGDKYDKSLVVTAQGIQEVDGKP